MKRTSDTASVSETAPTSGTTLVLLCGALSDLGNGLDLSEIERTLQTASGGVRVETVADLCDKPKALGDAVTGNADRAVLGLCSIDRDGQGFDNPATQAGQDPFSVTSVSLGSFCAKAHPTRLATNKAKVLLAAAVARARAFRGSDPKQVKPRLKWPQGRVSRRALFTLPPITYQPVAIVQAQRCASEASCDLCTAICPENALTIANNHLTIDKEACTACGLCVTTCPRGAIELATASLAQFEEELRALLMAEGLDPCEPRAILFVCDGIARVFDGLEQERRSLAPGWLPLRVPCTGMVSPGWVLQSLALGAAAVGLTTCAGECPFDQQGRVAGTVDYCRSILDRLGRSPDVVRAVNTASAADLARELEDRLERPSGPQAVLAQRPCLQEPAATVYAIGHFASLTDTPAAVAIAHQYSPLGVARIDAERCTGCEICVRMCPTGALISEKEADGLAITFQPSRCTGCGLCDRNCPEDAMQVERLTELHVLAMGKSRLYRDREVRCERCGVGFAPAAMVRRVERLLHDGGGAPAAIRRCPSCRGIPIGAKLGGN